MPEIDGCGYPKAKRYAPEHDDDVNYNPTASIWYQCEHCGYDVDIRGGTTCPLCRTRDCTDSRKFNISTDEEYI